MRLRMLVHRRREKQRLDDELPYHVDQQIAENIASGMTLEEALRGVNRRFARC
jgi:hypothetical protein